MLLLLVFSGVTGSCIHAQPAADPVISPPKGFSHSGSLVLHVPVGVFAGSHFAGAGLHYSWSPRRYGRNISSSKLIGLTFNTGADYYFGKKIKPAGYDFRYGGYLYFHAAAGILVNPWPNANISLAAGPTIGIYEGNADTGLGAILSGSYFITKNISVGPGITCKKHARADALWTGTIRASYIF